MKTPLTTILVAALLDSIFIACHAVTGPAQQPPDQPDLTLDFATRTEVIERTLKALKDSYVFPEVAHRMEISIRQRQRRKQYDNINSSEEFAATLTAHLQEISHDKHLRVFYSHERIREGEQSGPGPEDQEKLRQFGQFNNFGFEKVERLSGNVGYLDLRVFIPPEEAGETAAAAMNFLAHTSALIIDLRQNHGGHPAMVAFLCSYLFGEEPVHLNDIYWRPTNNTHQWWTLRSVPGKRYGNKPVYVLTSQDTFSGAEEFAYNLKNLKRATLIGETTGGGAHPGETHRVSEHFMVGVPSGRAINPISGTNWEGTGVKPDIEVPKEQALKTAHRIALQKVLQTNTSTPFTDEVRKSLESVQKELEKMKEEITRP